MKLVTNFPKKLFNKYISRSDDRKGNSFGSTGTTSSESSVSSHGRNKKRGGTPSPTTVLTPSLPYEIFEMEQAFKMMDVDGDGKIAREELAELLRRVGNEPPPSEEELNGLLAELDRDGDGCISLEEFEVISSAFGPPEGVSELRDAFDIFDTDRDGKITAEELLNVFRMIGDGRYTLQDCWRMISMVDKNSNGFVGFEDFSLMMELQR